MMSVARPVSPKYILSVTGKIYAAPQEIRQPWQTRTHFFKIHGYGHCTCTKAQVTSDSDTVFADHRDDRPAVVIHDRL